MKHYTNIKFIPIFNFFEIYETNDIRYLLKLDDYSELPEISEELSVKLQASLQVISDECSDNSTSDNDEVFECKKSIVTLSLRKTRINFICEILRYKYEDGVSVDHKYLEKELTDASYLLNYNNKSEFHDQLDNIQHASKGLDKRVKDEENKIKDLSVSDKKNTYMDAIQNIEEITGVKFDIYKDTMLYYLSWKKRFEQKIKKTA